MLAVMTLPSASLPDDIAALKAMVAARDQVIEALKLTISKLQQARHGASSERGSKLLDQLELQLAELQESAAQDEAATALAAPVQGTSTQGDASVKPARRALPEHLPRERIVHPGAAQCPCCGGRLRKLGEDVTETLEYVPACWKVIQHVRETFACRACEAITQANVYLRRLSQSESAESDKRSLMHRRRSIRSPAAVPGRNSWHRSCSANTGRICH